MASSRNRYALLAREGEEGEGRGVSDAAADDENAGWTTAAAPSRHATGRRATSGKRGSSRGSAGGKAAAFKDVTAKAAGAAGEAWPSLPSGSKASGSCGATTLGGTSGEGTKMPTPAKRREDAPKARSKSPYKGGKTKFLAPKAVVAAAATAMRRTTVEAALAEVCAAMAEAEAPAPLLPPPSSPAPAAACSGASDDATAALATAAHASEAAVEFPPAATETAAALDTGAPAASAASTPAKPAEGAAARATPPPSAARSARRMTCMGGSGSRTGRPAPASGTLERVLSPAASLWSPRAARRGSFSSEPDPAVLAAMAATIAATGELPRFLSPASASRGRSGMLSPSHDRPRRVGGGFASPSLASPPHAVPAVLAAQLRVNRRMSDARTRLSMDATAAAEEDVSSEEGSALAADAAADAAAPAMDAAVDAALAAAEAAPAVTTPPSSLAPTPATAFATAPTVEPDCNRLAETCGAVVLSPVSECSPAREAGELVSPVAGPVAAAFCTATFDSPLAATLVTMQGGVPPSCPASPSVSDAAPAPIANGIRLPFKVFAELDARIAATAAAPASRPASPLAATPCQQLAAALPDAVVAATAAPEPAAPFLPAPALEAVIAELAARCATSASAVPAAPEPAVLPALMPTSPLSVLRSFGALPPHTSPAASAPAQPSAAGAVALLTPLSDAALAAPIVVHAKVAATHLRRALFDTHTDYEVVVTVTVGTTVLASHSLIRRYSDFLAFYANSVAATAAGPVPSLSTPVAAALAASRLRAAAARFAFPPKVSIAPWRDAVVRDRAAAFNAFLQLVCCCVSGTTSIHHLPPALRAFLAC